MLYACDVIEITPEFLERRRLEMIAEADQLTSSVECHPIEYALDFSQIYLPSEQQS